MTTLVTRGGKGAALTHNEMDTNLQLFTPDIISKTADYTILTTDEGKVILSSPAAGSALLTLTLPAVASAGNGWTITIKHMGSGGDATTIEPAGAETIDGQTSVDVTQTYGYIQLVTDGSNWYSVASSKVDGAVFNASKPKAYGTNFRNDVSGRYIVNKALSSAFNYHFVIENETPNAVVTLSTSGLDWSAAAGYDSVSWEGFNSQSTDANGNFIFTQGADSLAGSTDNGDTWDMIMTVTGGIGGPNCDGVYTFPMYTQA